MKSKKGSIVLMGICFLFFMMSCGTPEQKSVSHNKSNLTFKITFPEDVISEISEFGLHSPITGRVYAIISKNDKQEPRFQTGFTGVPIWGKNIESLKPDEGAVIDNEVFGYPLESISEIPPGEYYVQGFINIYTEFKRSDGHTLWMHNDQWEGQQWNISPGNLYSDVVKIKIDPSNAQTIKLNCNHVIPAIKVPEDTKWIKRIKFQSKILTKFWGQPIYLGATILLPKGYDEHPDIYYPVHYIQGHFSLRAPNGFRTDPPEGKDPRGRQKSGYNFYRYWISADCPRMIAVTFQHPCPYYDDSYAVNSPNVGPYGDAVMEELIPYIEEQFRIIGKPYARILSGGSTGGWEALALQVLHPDFFGGTYPMAPDPVDFHCYELVNIYDDNNAYYSSEYEWLKVERPERRDTTGQISWTNRNYYYYEWTIGDRHRSGGNAAAWEAVYSPIGDDGYPKPLWDWYTGEIDHSITDYWKENYDLHYYLRKNWSWLGPKLVGKIHLYVGDMDSYYLNNAVVLLQNFLENTKDPYYAGTVEYGWRRPHVWGPSAKELMRLMEEHITKYAPQGEDTTMWKYK